VAPAEPWLRTTKSGGSSGQVLQTGVEDALVVVLHRGSRTLAQDVVEVKIARQFAGWRSQSSRAAPRRMAGILISARPRGQRQISADVQRVEQGIM
jgi:hypothetical protein